MTSETNTCSFCRRETEVLRQYLHAKNKPTVGDGFVYIYYCSECGLKEDILDTHKENERHVIDELFIDIALLQDRATATLCKVGNDAVIYKKSIFEILENKRNSIDTHTVKEECDACIHTKSCKDCVCVEHGQPTTPEKRCCSIDGKDGYHSLLCSRPDLKEEKKLPTSSYEVTCGRCEKSIKHSCGRV